MAQADRTPGFWQTLAQVPGRIPLRIKLITALLALVAIALGVISVTGTTILRGYLLRPIDASLTSQFNTAVADVQAYEQTGEVIYRQDIALDWITNTGVHAVVIPTSGYASAQGQPFGTPKPIAGPRLSTDPSWVAANNGRVITLPATAGADRWRVYMVTGTLTNGTTGTVVLAINATSQYTTIDQLVTIDVLASLGVIALLAIVGVAVVRRSLQPLTDIERTASAIAAGDLSRRVPERDPRTEVGRLGRALNVMLSQIESAFRTSERSEESARRSEEKMRQFVADASHELRTPLTAMRGFAEYYRYRGGISTNGNEAGELTPADLDRIMRRVEQEASRMGILVEDMLLLARMDQQRPLDARPVDLLSLAADAVHDARVVAPSRSINLTVATGAAPLIIGDEVRLRQVIGNLMSNALSHTPDGTPIDVLIRSGTLEETRPAAVLEVRDYGPGLTPEQAERVFERFYRADQARTSGGTGLGLAIVAALVAAHGGATWVSSEPGEGATFAIALPLSPEAAQGSTDDSGDEPEGDAVTPPAPNVQR